MSSPHRLALLCLLLGSLPLAAAADTGIAVLARPSGPTGGSWIPCGRIHAVGWVAYERVQAIRGAAPERFVGIHSCPSAGRLRGTLRLTLVTRRPPLWPRPGFAVPVRGLPTYYVRSAAPHAPPLTRRAGRLLGLERTALPKALRESGEEAGWVRYGPDLALRFGGERVVALRARVALGMSCVEAAAWLGYRAGKGRGFPLRRRWGCTWPGISERHRLARGVRGSLRDGVFELELRR